VSIYNDNGPSLSTQFQPIGPRAFHAPVPKLPPQMYPLYPLARSNQTTPTKIPPPPSLPHRGIPQLSHQQMSEIATRLVEHITVPPILPKRNHPSIPHNPITGLVPLPTDRTIVKCAACPNDHAPGRCPLRDVPIQRCPACGYHHFNTKMTCPLLRDKESVDAMFERLKESTEDVEVIRAAKSFLVGVRARMVRKEKR
jgi:Chromatin remodeling factor Mit1 C-terminal Zn finger 2